MRIGWTWTFRAPPPPTPAEWLADPQAARTRMEKGCRYMIRRNRVNAVLAAISGGNFSVWAREGLSDPHTNNGVRLFILASCAALSFFYMMVASALNEFALRSLIRKLYEPVDGGEHD